jgi:RNA polymerase sigma-70 factor (ECF subfamily)
MEPTDADLMRLWQAGDLGAFEDLVRRWQGPVARLLARLSGGDAADLTQEVFLRLFRNGERYREQGAFRTWIYRIVLSVARDAGRRRPVNGVPLADHEPLDAFAPPDALCRREAVERLAQALAELPEGLREVLVLRHYEGLNFEQIARLTGRPASTLKSRFAVALQRLRGRLVELGLAAEEDDR